MSGLDISQLGHTVQELFTAGLANTTQRVYQSGERWYTDFCKTANILPFPGSEATLYLFVAFLYKEGLAAGKVKSYLAAVRHAQIGAGLGDAKLTNMPKLEYMYVTKGMRRKTAGKRTRPRLPTEHQKCSRS